MACHEHHASACHLVGDGHSLLRIAGIIADFQNQLLSQNTACGVDISNGLLGSGAHLLTE